MILWIAIITMIGLITLVASYEAKKGELKEKIRDYKVKIDVQRGEITELNDRIKFISKMSDKEEIIVQIPKDKVGEFYGHFDKKTEDMTMSEQYKIFKFMEEIIGNKSDIFSYKNQIRIDFTNVLNPRLIGKLK